MEKGDLDDPGHDCVRTALFESCGSALGSRGEGLPEILHGLGTHPDSRSTPLLLNFAGMGPNLTNYGLI